MTYAVIKIEDIALDNFSFAAELLSVLAVE